MICQSGRRKEAVGWSTKIGTLEAGRCSTKCGPGASSILEIVGNIHSRVPLQTCQSRKSGVLTSDLCFD